MNSSLFMEERKIRTLRILSERSKVLVPDLCEIFNVSPVTIRNDLRELEKEGKLKRTHGGAIQIEQQSFEPGTSAKEVLCREQKKSIAQAALEQVQDEQIIAIDTGTTTMEFVMLLQKKKYLTIVTNDLQIALYAETNMETSNILMIGGSIRHGLHCAVGPLAISCFSDINVDVAFVAANGFSLEKGITTPSEQQAEVKRQLMQIAGRSILLADSSKADKVSFVKFADFGDLDMMITDDGIDKSQVQALKMKHKKLDIVIA